MTTNTEHLTNIATSTFMRLKPGKKHPWVVQGINSKHYQGTWTPDAFWVDLASFQFRPHAAACAALPELMALLIAVEEAAIAIAVEDADELIADLGDLAQDVREKLAQRLSDDKEPNQ